MLNSLSPSRNVSFLFTSDEHGYISPQSKLQNEVNKARQANPDGTLLISSGDIFEGSAETGVMGLEASREMLLKAGYDVVTVGNHDFDRGAEVAREWITKAPCDVLVSNLKDSETGELLPNTAASKVYELNGVKVGLIGVTTPETVSILPKAKLEGLAFQDPTTSVQAEVESLKAQGVGLIGLVSHLGLPADRALAGDVPELNFILGGHTHDAMQEPEQHGQTLIVHPGCFRQSMGHLQLDIKPITGQITRFDYRLIKGKDQEEEQGPVGQLANSVRREVEVRMGEKIATLPKSVEYDPNRLGEDMETLISEAIKEKTDADIVMINQKGLRAGLPQGDVSLGDLYNVFPFDDRLVTVAMTAEQASKLITESLERFDQTSFILTDDKFRYSVDLDSRQPEFVASALRGQIPECLVPLPESEKTAKLPEVDAKVPADRKVKVATANFLLEGGLGYFEPGRQQAKAEFGTFRSVLQEHLQTNFPIAVES